MVTDDARVLNANRSDWPQLPGEAQWPKFACLSEERASLQLLAKRA